MPELPEVEVICRGLRPLLVGRVVKGIRYNQKRLRHPVEIETMETLLPGRMIRRIRRRAKYLLIHFHGEAVLMIHLGMTGKLGLFPSECAITTHDHLCWQLDDGRELRYNDVRRFGSVRVIPPGKAERIEEEYFGRTGLEPLQDSCHEDALLTLATGKRRPIKSFLMDGSIIAGIGNIYANETLFSLGMHPSRAAGSLSGEDWHRLIDTLRATLLHAIACGGSTISDFVNADGTSGYFQMNFKVYGKTGQPCPVCHTPIEKVKLGGRASFYCPRCQSGE